MKCFAAITFLAALVSAGDISKSCIDESLNGDVLSLSCSNAQGTFQPASIELNSCLQYDASSKTVGWNVPASGNFAASCSACSTTRVPDPVYGKFGVTHIFMNCNCDGAAVSTSLDLTGITNVDGALKCGN